VGESSTPELCPRFIGPFQVVQEREHRSQTIIIVTQIITSTARTRFITLADTGFSAASSGQPRTMPAQEQQKK